MTASFEWAEVIGQQSKRQEYTKLILELGSGKDEALSTWLVILELVSITLNYSSEDEQQEWTQLQEYLKQLVRDTVYVRPVSVPLYPFTVVDIVSPHFSPLEPPFQTSMTLIPFSHFFHQ